MDSASHFPSVFPVAIKCMITVVPAENVQNTGQDGVMRLGLMSVYVDPQPLRNLIARVRSIGSAELEAVTPHGLWSHTHCSGRRGIYRTYKQGWWPYRMSSSKMSRLTCQWEFCAMCLCEYVCQAFERASQVPYKSLNNSIKLLALIEDKVRIILLLKAALMQSSME